MQIKYIGLYKPRREKTFFFVPDLPACVHVPTETNSSLFFFFFFFFFLLRNLGASLISAANNKGADPPE